MSTIPSRMKNTIRIIKNFLEHVSGIEKFILNVPYKYNRWPNVKIDISNDIEDPRFIINRTEDIGPLTKFMPSLEIVPDESILIVCDDMCYDLMAFKIIAEIQDRRLYEAFSFYVYKYSPDENQPKVGVPQGADLISMYTRTASNFPPWFQDFKKRIGINSYFDTPCFFVDDQVIGWYFQNQGIPMVQAEKKHRYIYIKDCENNIEKDNLNAQKGVNSRNNTMKGCYSDMLRAYPLN